MGRSVSPKLLTKPMLAVAPSALGRVAKAKFSLRPRRTGIRRLRCRRGVLGRFNTALELTNAEKFCTSCHEMRDNVFAEPKPTSHFSNRSGVRASCPDCHVPHNWTDKIARKMQASKQVWGHLVGTINTREKLVDHRLELALHEWARFKANDSLECRNCHSADSTDITKQSPRAAVARQRLLFTKEKTCIDCHKGIAHHLPEMRGIPRWQWIADVI
jgi:cytochrome c-type protein NapC